jgi:hypothetical protein
MLFNNQKLVDDATAPAKINMPNMTVSLCAALPVVDRAPYLSRHQLKNAPVAEGLA